MKIAKNNYYSIKKIKNGNYTDIHVSILYDSFPLYRYRPINKYTIEQFINDELFATVPVAFNDPYDATVRFVTREIKNHIKTKLIANIDFLNSLLKKNNLKRNQINKLVDFIYERDISPNIYFGNSTFALACFSTDINQEIMWAHYANLATGFALEYDYKELNDLGIQHQHIMNKIIKSTDFLDGINYEEEIFETPLLPVVYDNEKYDVSELCNQYIDLVLDYLEKNGEYNPLSVSLEMLLENKDRFSQLLPNVYCRKKTPWSYENEWRLICYNYNPLLWQANNYYVNVGSIIPKSIFLGEKISEYDKNALINIAKSKGLNIYIMKTVMRGKTIKLKPEKIEFH